MICQGLSAQGTMRFTKLPSKPCLSEKCQRLLSQLESLGNGCFMGRKMQENTSVYQVGTPHLSRCWPNRHQPTSRGPGPQKSGAVVTFNFNVQLQEVGKRGHSGHNKQGNSPRCPKAVFAGRENRKVVPTYKDAHLKSERTLKALSLWGTCVQELIESTFEALAGQDNLGTSVRWLQDRFWFRFGCLAGAL